MAKNSKNERNQILVKLWGKTIGSLTWVSERSLAYFFFFPDYFSLPYDLCPLTNPKTDPSSRHAIYGMSTKSPDPSERYYQGLPPFLADSLPDRWGNKLFDLWFEERGVKPAEKTAITKLSFIGRRAMGAFEFEPVIDDGFYDDKRVNIGELYQEALSVENDLSFRAIAPLNATVATLAALGTSPGGGQMKALVSIDEDGTYHSGSVTNEPSWRSCILKFNTPEYSLSEIEMTYYELAVEAGLPMMHSELITVDGVKHFLTDRYDRSSGKKIMTQTLAAINPDAGSYEGLFATCRRLGISQKEIQSLFRQTAFNWLMNNTDDHRKNFSFMMDDNYKWHLTPPYDITFIIAKNKISPEKEHCLPLRCKWTDVTEADLVSFARENNIRNPEAIISEIREASKHFEERAVANGVNGFYRDMISRRLNELGRQKELDMQSGHSFFFGPTLFEDARFEMTPSENIHLLCTIDGVMEKVILPHNKPLCVLIRERGLNAMDASLKESIFEDVFMQRARRVRVEDLSGLPEDYERQLFLCGRVNGPVTVNGLDGTAVVQEQKGTLVYMLSKQIGKLVPESVSLNGKAYALSDREKELFSYGVGQFLRSGDGEREYFVFDLTERTLKKATPFEELNRAYCTEQARKERGAHEDGDTLALGVRNKK